jgi:hypothetical protein
MTVAPPSCSCLRRDPFSDREQQILTIFATQVAMLLDTIHARERISNLATPTTSPASGTAATSAAAAGDRARGRSRLHSRCFCSSTTSSRSTTASAVINDVCSPVCGAVREILRPTDMLARYGGDSSGVLPHGPGRSDASRNALFAHRDAHDPDGQGAIQCSVPSGFRSSAERRGQRLSAARRRLYLSNGRKNRYTSQDEC